MYTTQEEYEKNVKAALEEAHRFDVRAHEYLESVPRNLHLSSSKELAAMKRASMDLTRALVKVRR